MITIAPEKRALYFGCWNQPGHYLHDVDGRTIWRPRRDVPGFCWDDGLLDAGLLKNGQIPDQPDGRVFWTCGGTPLWLAFYWWDRSVDRRGACNSGFYVTGFSHHDRGAALAFACAAFPHVVNRQRFPLQLTERTPAETR